MNIKGKYCRIGMFVIMALFLVTALSGSVIGDVTTSPSDGENDVPVDGDIIITFDYPMDTSTVNVAIEPDPGGTVTREWSNLDTTLKLSFSDSLSYEKKYIVIVTGNQTDAAFVKVSFTFTTEPAPIEVAGYDLQAPLPLIGISIWNIIVAIVVLIVGIIIARIAGRLVKKSLLRAKTSKILAEFMNRMVRIIITIFVVFTALASLGLGEHMAVVMGSVAIVIGFVLGFAMSDTLGNIAAGFMLAITKPFKAGDFVIAAGESGVIKSVGISVTELDTPDNKHIIIPNKTVFGSNIINFTRNDTRRVDMEVGVGYNDDLNKVVKTTMDIVKAHPKVLKDPEPQVAVSGHGDSAVVLVVRPWAKTADYWDVFFDLKKALKEGYDKEGISIPYPQMDVHMPEQKA